MSLRSVNAIKFIHFLSFSSGRSILANLKVSKKLNSVSGCSLEVLLIFVVSVS